MALSFKKYNFRLPNTLVIMFFLILLAILATWILHATGVKTLVKNPDTGQMQYQKIQELGILDLFYAGIKGFIKQAGLIFFVMSIGAFIYITIESQALDAFSQACGRKFKNRSLWLIPIFMLFFSLIGTTETLGEEKIPLYVVIIPIFMLAGFDKMTGFLVLMVGAGIGCMGATISPFVVNIAFQASKEVFPSGNLPYSDGLIWRIIGYITFVVIATLYVMYYAYRVQKDQTKSITYQTYEEDKKYFLKNANPDLAFSTRHKWIIAIFFITFMVMVGYLINWDSIFNTDIFQNAGTWLNQNIPYITAYIPGIGHGQLSSTVPLFIIAAIVVGVISKSSYDKIVNQLIKGSKNILSLALIISAATGIGVVLQSSHINSLIIESVAPQIKSLNTAALMVILFLLFLPISVLIPSTSGMIYTVFPVVSGVVGAKNVPGVIDAAAWANGLVNLISPTSFILMTALSVSKLEYPLLAKAIWPLFVILMLVSIALLAVGSMFNPQIF